MADDSDSTAGFFYRQPSDTKPNFSGAAKPRPKANGQLGPEPPPAEPTGPDAAGWLARCHTTKAGGPLATAHNAVIALRHAPDGMGDFRFDQMRQTIIGPHGPLQDQHGIVLHLWMQTAGLRRMGLDAVNEAIAYLAHENAFHPLRERLEALVWDGEDRMSEWLTRYFGAELNTYHSSIGFWFLISMIARVYKPGCKCDYMLVLESHQGEEKSQAIEILAGEYYSNNLPDLAGDAVRLSMHLAGKWIIEVADLDAFSRADATRLKAFLTTDTERYTRKFGRNEVREPRQCVFIGTTNKAVYLRDETGGRRFWPVKCGTLNLPDLKADRDQLLAQAVHEFKLGKPWWPDRAFETAVINPIQAARYEPDGWEQAVAEWDSQVPVCNANGRPLYDLNGKPERHAVVPPYRLLDIARGALHLQIDRLSRRDTLRLSAVLESMGWRRAPRDMVGIPWNPPRRT